jgi:ABC-type multidrug transport system fused ATPase/permease subunit
MQKKVKHTILGYFQFFYGIVGNWLYLNIGLSLLVSFLDGVGLTMFIPMLQIINGGKPASDGGKSLGALHYIVDIFSALNIAITIYSVLLLMVVVFLIKAVFTYLNQLAQIELRQRFVIRVRYDLTDNLKNISYSSFLKLDAGRIQNTLSGEVGKLYNAIMSYLGTLRSVAMLFTYIVFAFMANWKFAILVAVGACLSNLVFKRLFAAIKSGAINVSKMGHTFNDNLIQSIHNFKYLKATNLIGQYSNKLKKLIDDSEAINRKIGLNQALTSTLKEPFIVIIVAIVVAVQVRWMGGNISSAILSMILFYRALSFLIIIQTSWQTMMQNVGGIDSVSDLNYNMLISKEVQAEAQLKTITKGIRLQNLFFAYGDNTVLSNVNINIVKNKSVAFVGESGSGKTTLANIISSLIQPQSGNVLIDDVPLQDYNLDSYRSKIGYISQEAVVFNDTIFNNVTFWADHTPENLEKFWKCLEKASLIQFVSNLPNKEHTPLGNNGTLISGGQKQRISIARELYKDVEIFIMDEATSALDSETERFIQESVDKLKGQYTIIIIAHRLSTIKDVDTIYLLDKGVVCAEGTFDEIVTSSERFRKMVSLQEV